MRIFVDLFMQIYAIFFMLRSVIAPIFCVILSQWVSLNAATIIEDLGDQKYQFIVDGAAFKVKGVAGDGSLELLSTFKGNTMRTWAIEDQGEAFLDQAHRLGIKIIAGLWVEHERHGHDYDDEAFVLEQRNKILSNVLKYKDHPSILAWGLANEAELRLNQGEAVEMWKEINLIAKMVKDVDPDHPIITAVAGFNQLKIDTIKEHYPNIDILGVNGYGFAPIIGNLLKEYSWDKPYMITEFGPLGPWEGVEETSWGAPIEETSHQKAQRYALAHIKAMDAEPGHCLGTFPFYWGYKQETTTTWFGMLLPGGEHLAAVDAMAHAWHGEYPQNRVPEIQALESKAKSAKIAKRSRQKASLKVIDHENDPLKYRWVIMEESKVESMGGDFEETPKSFPKLIIGQDGPNVDFKAPSKKGAYRLFAYVVDPNKGAATANFPFYVK